MFFLNDGLMILTSLTPFDRCTSVRRSSKNPLDPEFFSQHFREAKAPPDRGTTSAWILVTGTVCWKRHAGYADGGAGRDPFSC